MSDVEDCTVYLKNKGKYPSKVLEGRGVYGSQGLRFYSEDGDLFSIPLSNIVLVDWGEHDEDDDDDDDGY